MSVAQAEAKSVVDDIIYRSTGIGVSDLAKSTDFYTRVLGMTHVQTLKLDYMDENILSYPAENFARGSRLVLMHWTDGSKRDYKNLPVKLVLQVKDAKAVVERVRAEGFEVMREAGKSKASNNTVAFVKDPDGYMIELLQPAQG